MAKVLTYDGKIKIGAYKFPDRKKVCLCIEKGNEIIIYGTFNSENGANDEKGNRICPFCCEVKLNNNQLCCEKCKKSLLEKYKKEEKGE